MPSWATKMPIKRTPAEPENPGNFHTTQWMSAPFPPRRPPLIGYPLATLYDQLGEWVFVILPRLKQTEDLVGYRSAALFVICSWFCRPATTRSASARCATRRSCCTTTTSSSMRRCLWRESTPTASSSRRWLTWRKKRESSRAAMRWPIDADPYQSDSFASLLLQSTPVNRTPIGPKLSWNGIPALSCTVFYLYNGTASLSAYDSENLGTKRQNALKNSRLIGHGTTDKNNFCDVFAVALFKMSYLR